MVFQILCEAGLLPGALIRNRSLQFRSEFVHLKVMHDQSPFTQCTPDGTLLRIPIAHGEGCYYADEKTLAEMEDNRQILWKYATSSGDLEEHANPNGSVQHIAESAPEKATLLDSCPTLNVPVSKSSAVTTGSMSSEASFSISLKHIENALG